MFQDELLTFGYVDLGVMSTREQDMYADIGSRSRSAEQIEKFNHFTGIFVLALVQSIHVAGESSRIDLEKGFSEHIFQQLNRPARFL